jgi:hypothetical protein
MAFAAVERLIAFRYLRARRAASSGFRAAAAASTPRPSWWPP